MLDPKNLEFDSRVGPIQATTSFLRSVVCEALTLLPTFKKSNLHYTRGTTPERATTGGTDLHGWAPGQHSSEKTSQSWRAVIDTVRFNRPGN